MSLIKPYQILEHTADLKIKAFGRDLPELFSNALKGMFESIRRRELEVGSRKLETRRKIKIKSPDLESLLVDFLSEALYLSDINDEAYFEAEFDKLTEKELNGEIRGAKVRNFKEEIKAVTYHGLEIKKRNKIWEATVLFDI
jgi:SHS2 domain-containing protein